MDSKKTNLTPELKEIYDRVMNTSSPQQPTSPKTPAPSPAVTPPPPASQPSHVNPLEVTSPAQPLTAPASPTPSPTPPPTTTPPPPAAPQMPSLTLNAEDALTNTPARPITEGNTFAFSGNSKSVPTASPGGMPTKPKGKAKISLPIIIGLAIAFIAVWGVFWAIILGIINT